MLRAILCSCLFFLAATKLVAPAPGISWNRSPLANELVEIQANDEHESPWFCHDLDCPVFKTVKKFDTFDLRCYGEYQWVTTNTSDLDYEKAIRTAFMRLFDYIGGENVDKQKIPMTAPVAVHILPGQGPFCASTYVMSFFVPFKWQGKAPAPSKSNVYLSKVGKSCFYVRSFGGYATDEDVIKNAVALNADLQKAKIKDFTSKSYFTAGYDSPFRPVGRHNEIWFLQNAEE